MALSGKEKQAQYRAKRRKSGYKLVQVWVEDKEAIEFKEYMKAWESGKRLPRTSIKPDCEWVSLEINVKSDDIAVRNKKVNSFLWSFLDKAAEAYKEKDIPKYLYLDIVELLRPIAGRDLYYHFKKLFELGNLARLIRRYEKRYNALTVDWEDHLAEYLGIDVGLDLSTDMLDLLKVPDDLL
jgi:hypothetical protein